MARPEGLEPPTLCFEGRCSIQLSYRRSLPNLSYYKHLRHSLLHLNNCCFRYIRYSWGRNRLGQLEPDADFVGNLLTKRHVPFQHGIVVPNRPVRVTEPESLDVRRNRVLAEPCHPKATKDVGSTKRQTLLFQQWVNDAVANV
jgi:hypothetical protein